MEFKPQNVLRMIAFYERAFRQSRSTLLRFRTTMRQSVLGNHAHRCHANNTRAQGRGNWLAAKPLGLVQYRG
jgi:hypothetical protein